MKRSLRSIAFVLLISWFGAVAGASAQDFKVAWTGVGEVKSAGKDAAPVQQGSKIVRVNVEPAIVTLAVGKQVCLSTLAVRAFGPDGRALGGAPMTIEIRLDHKTPLQLTHPKGDICLRPARAGEFPVRFTSKLPAPDSTQRGAQVFFRAQ